MQHRAISACPLKYSLRICEFCLPPVADADRRDACGAKLSAGTPRREDYLFAGHSGGRRPAP